MRPGLRIVASAMAPVVQAGRAVRREHSLTLVGWHRVDGACSDGLSTGVDDFRRHLDCLEDWGAVVLPLAEAVARLRDGTLPARAVALTFDDGYASVVTTAWPMLHERGMPMTLFVVSGFIAGRLDPIWDDGDRSARLRMASPEELLDASRSGLDIGSHTATHPWLPHLGPEELDTEMRTSRAELEDLLGREVDSIAYPTGGWDPVVRRAAQAAGYRLGVTVDRGVNTARTHPLSLRRAFAPHDTDDLRLLLDGGYSFLRPLDRWRTRNGPVW